MENLKDLKSLSGRLAFARERAGHTQKAVATAASIAQPTYAGLEKGGYKGTAKIVEIALFLGVNPIWLATGRGKMELTGGLIDESFIARTPEEQTLLLDFREASPQARRKARSALLGSADGATSGAIDAGAAIDPGKDIYGLAAKAEQEEANRTDAEHQAQKKWKKDRRKSVKKEEPEKTD